MNFANITNLIVSATSIAAIAFAVYSFAHQNYQSKLYLGIQILRDWEQFFFNSDEMRKKRYVVSRYFKEGSKGALPIEAYEILDTFDSIGIYLNKGIVDKEIAWLTFYFWLDHYWFLLKDELKKIQDVEGGVNYLCNLEKMHDVLTVFGTKNHQLPLLRMLSQSKIELFIDDELASTCDPRWANES